MRQKCAMVQAKVWSWISAKFRSASFSFSWCLEPLECMRMIFLMYVRFLLRFVLWFG